MYPQKEQIPGLLAYQKWAGMPVALPRILDHGRDSLRRKFGVDDLSVIEAGYLRRSALSAIEAFGHCVEQGTTKFHIGNEIAYRWLSTCYGVSLEMIDREVRSKYGPTSEFKEWLFRARFRSHVSLADNQFQDGRR